MSARTVKRAVHKLESLGLLTVKYRGGLGAGCRFTVSTRSRTRGLNRNRPIAFDAEGTFVHHYKRKKKRRIGCIIGILIVVFFSLACVGFSVIARK